MLQDVDWNDSLSYTIGDGITYSGGKWSITTNGTYQISAVLSFIANEGEERMVSASFVGEGSGVGSGTQISSLGVLTKHDSDANSYNQLVINAILPLTTTADPFKFQVRSLDDGTGSLNGAYSYVSISRIA